MQMLSSSISYQEDDFTGCLTCITNIFGAIYCLDLERVTRTLLAQ